MSVFLAHINVVSPEDITTTLYVSDMPVRPFPSTDVDMPNQVYTPLLLEAANIRRNLFGDVTRGGGETGYGVLKLSNADGSLSYLRSYVFREITIWRYEHGQAFNTAQRVFKGMASRANWKHKAKTTSHISLSVQSNFKMLEQNLQGAVYDGSGGLEGDSGLSGRPKPVTLGDLSTGHVSGVLVDAGAQIWQLHSDGLVSLDAVYDRGDDAGYSNEGDLSGTAFDASTPSVIGYITDLERGLVKLGGNPVGDVAFSVTETPNATARSLAKRLLLEAGISAADIDVSFDVSGGPVVGIHAVQNMTIEAAIRFLARSEFAAVMPDRTGSWTYSPLKTPTGASEYDLGYDDILELTPQNQDSGPVGTVRIGYDKNHTSLNRASVAPAIHGSNRETYLENEWRYAIAQNLETQTKYPNAKTLDIKTPIRSQVAAQSLADTVLATLGPRPEGGERENLRLVLPIDTPRLQVPLGAVVHLEYPDANIDGNYILIGAALNRPKSGQMIWRVWG